ncbi:MAG: T9SS type A sorting domain-containing protein [Bacillota bacterium]
MKKKILQLCFLGIIVISTTVKAQIPNAGFENWTNGEPDQWWTSNATQLFTNVTRSATAHSGQYALKGEVVSTMVGPMQPIIQTGKDAKGFAVSQRYARISGYYQFNSISGDRLGLNFGLFKGDSGIAVAAAAISVSANSYTKFDLPFVYLTNDVPDKCVLQVQIVGPTQGNNWHVGSSFLIDDLSLSGTAATSVKTESNLTDYVLEQNYPNPFNPSTNISFTIPQNSFVSLKVYDVLGNIVSTLINEQKPAGSYRVSFSGSNLPSGLYIYELKAGSYSMMKKMMLVK